MTPTAAQDPFFQVQALARAQGFIVSEQQCLKVGFTQPRIYRLLRRGEWTRVLPGVYFTSAGQIQWFSRLHAALLYSGSGAAISHESAGFIHGFVSEMPRRISVVIPEKRRVRSQPQVTIQRRRTLPQARGNPAVTTPAETLVDLFDANIAGGIALGYATGAIRKGVRPQDVLLALSRRKRHRNRRLLRALLSDAQQGIESPLEYYFVRNVESAHALPISRKQAPKFVGGRWIRSDCHYEAFQLRLELDGELAHPGGRTNSDVWRDNALAIQEFHLTLRYRWHHIIASPCETARQISTALQQRGWQEEPKRCGASCRI